MKHKPCMSRVFRLELESVFDYVQDEYSHWFDRVTERLGRELTETVWNCAFSQYDTDLLTHILADRWEVIPGTCELEKSEKSFDGSLRAFFTHFECSPAPKGVSDIVTNTPPLPQLREKLAAGPLQGETTTYNAIHLYCHGFALLAESLIDHVGRMGALLVYDIRLEEVAGTNFEQLSVNEFVRRRHERFTGVHTEYDMHTAGLEVEVIEVSDTEISSRTKECEWARYYLERHPRVGYLMCCSVDDATYRAINNQLRLQRTVTLMDGGPYCDFRIFAAS